MTITVSSLFVSPPRISRGRFVAVLSNAGSPWAAQAGDLFDLIASNGHDPSVWLAVAGREHSYGANRDSVLWRNDTRSWTNARTVRDPSLTNWSIVVDPVRKSEYVRYASVADSLRDGMYRITDPTYRYVREKRTTIGQVLAIWTESEAAEYGAWVVARMNEWEQSVMPLALPTAADLGYPVQVVWADASVTGPYEGVQPEWAAQRKRMGIRWQVVHDTEGWWPTDRDYLQRGNDASARAVIAPDGTVCIMAPLDEIAWTGGSSLYNALGAHYELSGFAHIGYSDAQYRALAALMVFDNRQMQPAPPLRYVGRSGANGIIAHADIPNPIPGVRCNGQWGGASCHSDPGPKFDWTRLAGYINDIVQGAPVPTPGAAIPGAQLDPWDGYAGGNPYAKAQGEPFWVLDPFVDWIKGHGGFWTVGFVASGAFIDSDTGVLTQWFEGGALEWHPENAGTEYAVLRRHVGLEMLRARYPDRVPA